MTQTFLYELIRLAIIMLGAFLIAIVWLPYHEHFYVSDDALVQDNEGVNGYEVGYYSIIQAVLLIP